MMRAEGERYVSNSHGIRSSTPPDVRRQHLLHHTWQPPAATRHHGDGRDVIAGRFTRCGRWRWRHFRSADGNPHIAALSYIPSAFCRVLNDRRPRRARCRRVYYAESTASAAIRSSPVHSRPEYRNSAYISTANYN